MSRLTIYRASAGSGKTYTLTREYLTILLAHPGRHRQILAVTFTNKATAEMKNRVMQYLYELMQGRNEALTGELAMILDIKPEEIRIRAEERLYALLHDYSRFSISTIDSFFQKIIRSFTRELGLYSGYTVELDQAKVLKESIGLMMDQLGDNPMLKEWLIEIIEEKIRDGHSWNIDNTLLDFGAHLFEETWQILESELLNGVSGNRDLLRNYITSLKKLKEDFESEMKLLGQEALTSIKNQGYTVDDFSFGSTGVAGYFEKMVAGKEFAPGKRVLDAAENPESWVKKTSPIREPLLHWVKSDLQGRLQQALEVYQGRGKAWRTAAMMMGQIYNLGITFDLMEKIKEYAREQNIFLLSGAPVFLKKIIDGSDTPFIYERVGGIYNYYMIDEFQDTSSAQWNNFKPLIRESLSGNHPDWVVGDVKQAIYRWRNTDWSILGEQIEKDLPGQTDTAFLSYNWRSEPEIIGFNNEFFEKSTEYLKRLFQEKSETELSPETMQEMDLLESAYRDVRQSLPPGKSPEGNGYIRFCKIEEKESWKEEALQDMVLQLETIQSRGYSLRDIAILTRTGDEAVKITEFLQGYKREHPGSPYRYEIISNESLRVQTSSAVRFIMGSMQWICDPGDRITAAFLNREYSDYLVPILGLPQKSYCDWLQKEAVALKKKPVFEFATWLIRALRLDLSPGQAPYIQSISDEALSFSKRESSDISSFLTYWEEKKEKKTLTMPDDQDAIQLMTIHKSKGLEFEYVIIPFCEWSMSSSRGNKSSLLWCHPDQAPFNEVPVIPFRLSPKLADTLFAKEYHHERMLSYIDNLNLLYVAFTRAKKGLIAWIPPGNEKEKISEEVSGMIRDCIFSADQNIFEKGCIPVSGGQKKKMSVLPLPQYKLPKGKTTVSILPSSRHYSLRKGEKIDKGSFLHELFCSIQTLDDLAPELMKQEISGILSAEERFSLEKEISEAIHNDQIKDWFSTRWKVRNEASIVLPSGVSRRPDRVITNHEEALIIDYKFGAVEEASYKSQIREYKELMMNMGYRNIRGFIWYVFLKKVVEV